MSEPGIIVSREGHLTTIRINRAERLNAIDGATGAALGKAFQEFEADHDQWVAILTGSGRAFCTGNDLRDMAAGANPGRRRPGSHGYGWASITKRFPLYKPVIAAINGFAVAGGLEMALVCDILVAAESAKFGLTEVKWALMPTGGGTQRLPRSVPRAWANYMIFTGEQLTAQEAKEIGLVSHVVRVAVEMGVDAVKTTYTGTAESFAEVVASAETRTLRNCVPSRDTSMSAVVNVQPKNSYST